jgi:putative ABC transport system ATP-binding protein
VPARAARDRADETLRLLGLGTKQDMRPLQMSGGEKQRVAVGRALVKEPEVIFADEPTSALDWKHGRQVVELLCKAARDRGATVFVVSHDARVVSYADQVLHLEDGRLNEHERTADPARN